MDDFCQIGKKLGSGSWGEVYALGDNGKYVIKKLTGKEETLYESTVEVDILFRLDSPYVIQGVKLLDPSVCKNLTTNGYALNAADGTFWNLIDGIQTVSRNEDITLCYQIAMGLKCLHDNNYLHLDVTTSNCMYIRNLSEGPFYRGVLIDFGLSACIQRDNKNNIIPYFTSQPRITSSYRPPECFIAQTVSNNPNKVIRYTDKSDIWSLAIVFIELFYKKSPYNICESVAPPQYLNKLKLANGKYKKELEDSLYDICVEDQIPKLFNDMNRRKTIDILVGNIVPASTKEAWIDLLYKMLEIDETKRININDVVNHKVFADSKLQCDKIFPLNCSIKSSPHREAFSMKSERKKVVEMILPLMVKHYGNFTIEAYFTALDITLRTFSLFDELTSEEWLTTYMLTCVSLAMRLYEFYNMLPYNLKNYSTKNIYEREIKVLKMLKGILREPKIYNYSNTLQEMYIAHVFLFYSNESLIKYTSMDMTQFFRDISYNDDLKGDKNVTISTFSDGLKKATLYNYINYGKTSIAKDLMVSYPFFLDYDIRVWGLSIELYKSYCEKHLEVSLIKVYIKSIFEACIILSFKHFYNKFPKGYIYNEMVQYYINSISKEISYEEKIYRLCVTVQDWRDFYEKYINTMDNIINVWKQISKLPPKEGERKVITMRDVYFL